MTIEGIRLDLTSVTKELPYRDYYKGRNGLVAQKIATFFDLPYLGEGIEGSLPDESIFYVPAVTQLLSRFGTEDGFYGLAVENVNHVHKAILHPTVSISVPSFYSADFAVSVRDCVLPGTVAFCGSDLETAYLATRKLGNFDVRAKSPDRSDGLGQEVIKDISQLGGITERLGVNIYEKGLVFEADLIDNRTISVGFTSLGGSEFSFLALQKNDIAPEDGRSRYMGANVRVVRGDMANLDIVTNDEAEKGAVRNATRFYSAYSYFNPAASRLSFDNLIGKDRKGDELSGITDITGRLGGTCPALLMAVLALKENKNAEAVNSEVSLNYSPTNELETEKGAEKFIDLPSLRLTARINSII